MILSQINGLAISALICITVYFIADTSHWNVSKTITVPLAERCQGAVIIELTGDNTQRGIYFLPPGATLQNLFTLLDIPGPGNNARHQDSIPLVSGTALTLDRHGHIRYGEMAAAKRLALDLPIDLNKATFDDLILVPGIKEATAQKIIAARQAAGSRFNRVEDLMQVKGIKEKRLQRIRPYLYVLPGRA